MCTVTQIHKASHSFSINELIKRVKIDAPNLIGKNRIRTQMTKIKQEPEKCAHSYKHTQNHGFAMENGQHYFKNHITIIAINEWSVDL